MHLLNFVEVGVDFDYRVCYLNGGLAEFNFINV